MRVFYFNFYSILFCFVRALIEVEESPRTIAHFMGLRSHSTNMSVRRTSTLYYRPQMKTEAIFLLRCRIYSFLERCVRETILA